jgi:hypothetical protein
LSAAPARAVPVAAAAPASFLPASLPVPRASIRAGGGREIRIDALNLSIPGADAGYGRRVAERVTELLAQRWPARLGAGRAAARHIGGIGLTVRPPSGTEQALSESIVEAVLGAMEKG